MNQDLQALDSNQIINSLDELISQGNSINDIASALSDVHIIANYDRLIQKGATNINLAKIKDTVDPEVILNNIAVFQNNNIHLDMNSIMERMSDAYWKYISEFNIEKWQSWGISSQTIADKFVQANGIDLNTVEVLLNAGAHVNPDKIIDNLLYDEDYLIEDFYAENDVAILKQAGASPETIQKLLKRVSDLTVEDEFAEYGGPYPDKLDLNENGKQTAKIFFTPQIQIIAPAGGRDLPVDWSGRILPGQTIDEGIAAELKEIYGYTGKFGWRNPYFKEWAKDNQGNNIQRFGLYVTLFPTENDQLPGKI
jgi:hypothetical protein